MAEQMYIDPATGAVTPKKVPGAIPIDPATGAADPGGRIPGTAVKGFSGGGDVVQGGLTGSADAPSDQGPSAGGGATSGVVGGGKTYNPDEMINTYLPGLTPEQHAAVRDALKGAEGGSGVNYHKAIDDLTTKHPELSQYTKWGKAFPAQQQGQMSPEAYQKILQMTQAYQQPFLQQIKSTATGVADSLKKLLPSLPASYKGLIASEIPAYQGMATQLPAQIQAADPGMIANAYAQYYSPATTATSGSNPISSLLAGAQQNPQTLTSDRNLKANITPVGW